MKEENVRKMDEEFQKLKEETLRRRAAVIEKYKDAPHPSGLDTSPEDRELGDVTRWFGREVKKIKSKYGLQ